MINKNDFKLDTIEDVVRFDNFLNEYCYRITQTRFALISLSNAFTKTQKLTCDSRLFTAILDLKINFVILNIDHHYTIGISNEYFTKGKYEGGKLFDDFDKFYRRMELHRNFSNFVFRYRAIWDKLMGIIIFFAAPEKHEDYSKAVHKKKTFEKIIKGIRNIPKETDLSIIENLTKFDNEFRTSEAHGTGRLRKYSLSMDPICLTPMGDILSYWNYLLQCLREIDKMIISE